MHEHARAVDRDEWSRLSVNLDARLDQRWFLLNDADIPVESRYLSVWSQGRLRALAPCLISLADGPGVLPHRASDVLLATGPIGGAELVMDRSALKTAGQAFRQCVDVEAMFPSIAVAAPCSAYAPVAELLCRTNSDLDIFEHTVEAIGTLASDISARLIAILGVRGESILCERAVDFGFLPALIFADTVLKVPWASFDEYLGSIGSKRRGELIRARHSDIELALEPNPGAIVEDLARVAVSHFATLNYNIDMDTLRGYICGSIRWFGRHYRIIVARRRGEVIGFSSVLSNGLSHKAVDLCIDREKAARGGNLFLAFMCEAVRDVIGQGGGTITFGATTYRAKLSHGCSLEPLWGLYKASDSSLQDALAEYLAVYNRVHTDCFGQLRRFEHHTPVAGA